MSWWAFAWALGGTALLLWLTGVFFTTILQHRFIFRPEQTDMDFKYSFHADFEEGFLNRPDGAQVHYLRFKAGAPSRRVVFYCHGNAGDLRKWGHRYADFLPQGWDLVVWDYRGFGKSSGHLSESALLGDSVTIAKDLADAYGPDNLIIYGRSIGSAMACAAAAEVPCRHLVLETPFSSMRDLFFTYYPFLPRIFPFAFTFDNVSRLKRCHAPVTVFQGNRDYVVPHRCAVKLRQSFKQEDRFFTLPGASHSDVGKFEVYKEELQRILE